MLEDRHPRFKFLPEGWEHLGSQRVGQFLTRVVHRRSDGSKYVWDSRRSRRRRGTFSGQSPWLTFWAPRVLGWWVAVLFILGSALFILAASASLFPAVFGGEAAASNVTDVSYFVGALIFSVSIYLQILEALNSDEPVGSTVRGETPHRFRYFGWQPHRLGFLTPFVLFVGSVLFNLETTFALISGFSTIEEDLFIGIPSFFGAVCFVVSSYMMVVEVSHGYWSWKFRDLGWWVGVLSLVGSAGFLVGAAFGFSVPGLSALSDPPITNSTYFQGSIFFLASSYLMLPETFSK